MLLEAVLLATPADEMSSDIPVTSRLDHSEILQHYGAMHVT